MTNAPSLDSLALIEDMYRSAGKTGDWRNLTLQLQHWYQAFPRHHYLQPCMIDGQTAIVCQKQLSIHSPTAFRTLKAICSEHGIYLKEDARSACSSVAVNRRQMAVVLSFCLLMGSTAHAAGRDLARSVNNGNASAPTVVNVVYKNQTLAEVVQSINRQSGIVFKFNAAVETDRVHKTLSAQNWQGALAQLLEGYNYSTIQDDNRIKTVFIMGYNGTNPPKSDEAPVTDMLAGDAFNQQETLPVCIPTETLASLPEGGSVMVDLPVGSFNVSQESMVAMDDGTLSWVGTMDDTNQFNRLYLALTQDGDLVGNVFTPEGAYNIETIDGQTVMVAVEQVGMR